MGHCLRGYQGIVDLGVSLCESCGDIEDGEGGREEGGEGSGDGRVTRV